MIDEFETIEKVEIDGVSYYKDRYCLCGCGKQILVKPWNKYNGIPVFINGHNQRGKIQSEESNKKRSESMTGDKNPTKRPEVKLIMSLAHIGKKHPSETIQKMSESQKIAQNTPEAKEARRKRKPPRLGTDTSPQARRNMSEGAMGKVFTQQHRDGIQQGLIRHFSILENRVKRAKQVARRIQKNGYQYKTGYVSLPRLGLDLFYRSSYEQIGLLLLDSKKEAAQILVETLHIPYVDEDDVEKIYVPDWLVTLDDGKQVLIEVKPNAFVDSENFKCKIIAALDWCKKNNTTFCVWTEDILFNNSSTTTSLRVIVEATATAQNGRRDSLNCTETCRERQK